MAEAGAGAPLETEKAERRVWLVRVPPHIAEKWKEACTKKAGDGVSEEDADGAKHVLGQIKILTGGAQGTQTFLDLTGTSIGGGGIPQQYSLKNAPELQHMHTISYAPSRDEPNPKMPRVEGVVTTKFDMVPIGAALGQGAADEAYRQLARRRKEASTQRGRGVEVISDLKEVKKLSRGNVEPLWSRDRPQKAPAETITERRRVRLERDELEQRLFGLFEGQPRWSFNQLQKETNQPSTWLKEVLNDLAFQIKRGPDKDLWQLKQHLTTGGAAGAGGSGAGGDGGV